MGRRAHTRAWRASMEDIYQVQTIVGVSGTFVPSSVTGRHFDLTLGGNLTISAMSDIRGGEVFNVVFRQDGTGGHTVSWGSGFIFVGGSAPVITAAANAVDLVSIFCVSESEYLLAIAQNFS